MKKPDSAPVTLQPGTPAYEIVTGLEQIRQLNREIAEMDIAARTREIFGNALHTIGADLLNAIGGNARDTITVTWTNGTRATYSAHMTDMIRTDPAAIEIMDNQTGEILLAR